MHRGIATFTLDYGTCPPWLFERMVKLSRIITMAIVDYFGADEFLKRMGDPVWFQAFGSLLAFDWNASGLTTTVMGALKESLRGYEQDLGIFICGGKGKTSKKTPDQIIYWSEKADTTPLLANQLVSNSKLAAKVDSALVQDGFTLYHHNFMFSKSGNWTVIQQGMNTQIKRARRYHWHSASIQDPLTQPHSGISNEATLDSVLNLVHKDSQANKDSTLQLIQHKKELFFEIKRVKSLINGNQLSLLDVSNKNFGSHPIQDEQFTVNDQLLEIFNNKRLEKAIANIYDKPVTEYKDILMTKAVGAKTIRALSLATEIISGAKPSYEDPVRYTYAFGGKDGIPYPVETDVYDKTIEIIEKAIKKSSLGYREKEEALQKSEKILLKTSLT